MPSDVAHRADFERNERRILDAAAHLIADVPAAGMAEIASAAGLGRATVYRHFPTRDDLIGALHNEAFEEGARAIERHTRPVLAGEPGADRPIDALRRIVEELVDEGDRYRLLLFGPEDGEQRAMRRRRFEAPLTQLVERAQAAGELDGSVPASWVIVSLGGLLGMGLKARSEGEISADEVKRLVPRALLQGFGPAR